eukprot:TRINITY_DN3010_c0_g1_i2.p1 TRINITY_DN3010_c0_g1~~TRINITY_DN3010_c0_g1_i2.p1  ORF type:complete len:557 (-),score=113.82 TRINITY_DN3010_c0_g1_i2:8-1639(-)
MIFVVSGAPYVDYFQLQTPLVDCPNTPRIRRAWHKLSDVEKQQFAELVVKMKTHSITIRPSTKTTVYNWFVDVHNANSATIHGNSFFLPTHRYLAFLFESALRWMARLYNSKLTYPLDDVCSITLPYWDWLLDFENDPKDNYLPQNNSAVFKGGFLGPAPSKKGVSNYEVPNSFLSASSWVTVAGTNNNPSVSNFQNTKFGNLTKSLKRLFNPNVVFVYGPSQVVHSLITKTDFVELTMWMEGPHNIQHRWLSFQMQTMYSPDDVLFWLHHTNLDRLWAIQQDCQGWENLPPSAIDNYYSNATSFDQIDARIPLYWKGGLPSSPMAVSDFPTPRNLWSLGQDSSNYDGMYYRYGPDELLQGDLFSTCPDQTWSWVNVKSTKRDIEDGSQLSPTTLQALDRWFTLLKSYDAKNALYYAAVEECKGTPRVDIDESLYHWMMMQGTTPEWYDRVCDSSSSRFYLVNGKDWRNKKVIFKYAETVEDSTQEIQSQTRFSPIALIAGVAGVAVFVVSLTVFFVVRSKKQAPKEDETTQYQLTENFLTSN